MTRYKINVIGKVQGVWFRKYTFDKAQELHLKGYVMNKPDGTVYIEVDEANNISSFLKWLYTGSPLSKVTDVKIEKTHAESVYKNFEIRR